MKRVFYHENMYQKAVSFGLIAMFLTACGPGFKTLVENQNLPVSDVEKAALLNAPEAEFLSRVNALRAEYDLPLLEIHPVLQGAARRHSAYMNGLDLLTHSQPSPNQSSSARILNAGGHFEVTGENIACGNASAEAVFNQWFNSTAHLRNMISVNYRYIGIAREGSSAEAKYQNCPYYWTTDFAGD